MNLCCHQPTNCSRYINHVWRIMKRYKEGGRFWFVRLHPRPGQSKQLLARWFWMAPLASTSCYVLAACCALHEVMGQQGLRMFSMRFFEPSRRKLEKRQPQASNKVCNKSDELQKPVSQTTGSPSPTDPTPKLHCQIYLNYSVIQLEVLSGGPQSTSLQWSREGSATGCLERRSPGP